MSEFQKPWAKPITDDDYAIAVGLKPAKEQGDEKRSDTEKMVQPDQR